SWTGTAIAGALLQRLRATPRLSPSPSSSGLVSLTLVPQWSPVRSVFRAAQEKTEETELTADDTDDTDRRISWLEVAIPSFSSFPSVRFCHSGRFVNVLEILSRVFACIRVHSRLSESWHPLIRVIRVIRGLKFCAARAGSSRLP